MSIITPVILSGGSGTRLWPLSRAARPKQLLPLSGTATMLQETLARVDDPMFFGAPVVVANGRHADEIEAQLRAVGMMPAMLVLEPVARNTAPAIAAAAALLDPDAIMLVMPSDHVVADVRAFRAAVRAALPAVADDWLVTFGITPDSPETGYGYLRIGGPIAFPATDDDVGAGVHVVERFVEKPDAQTARSYLEDGGYAWNGGIFMFRAGAFLEALGEHAPDIAEAALLAARRGASDGLRVIPEEASFASCRAESVDYAVMERSDRVAVVPVDMGWSDLGSWDALHALGAGGEDGNVHAGDVVSIGSSGCLVRSHGPVVATIGVEDLIIVATPDAVLVTRRGASQDVKLAVDRLKAIGHPSLDDALKG